MHGILRFFPVCPNHCALLNARRERNFQSEDQAKFLVNSYILSRFNYCPLAWMFCGKGGSNLIEKSHHRVLCALKLKSICRYPCSSMAFGRVLCMVYLQLCNHVILICLFDFSKQSLNLLNNIHFSASFFEQFIVQFTFSEAEIECLPFCLSHESKDIGLAICHFRRINLL